MYNYTQLRSINIKGSPTHVKQQNNPLAVQPIIFPALTAALSLEYASIPAHTEPALQTQYMQINCEQLCSRSFSLCF